MNNNWDQILRAIVPLSFLAIWALTALFNRESKGFPARPPSPTTAFGPKPTEPTTRWAAPPPQGVRRVPIGDDDILIIQNDSARTVVRPSQPRSPQTGGPRRGSKVKPLAPAARKEEPPVSRTKLGGVSQIVNQQLATPAGLTPLTTIAPMVTSTSSELANSPSAPSKTSAILTVSTLIPLMNDPVRLREAFIVNELLQPPLTLRGRRGHRR